MTDSHRTHRRLVRTVVGLALAIVIEAVVVLQILYREHRREIEYRQVIYQACVVRNAQWDAVLAKDKALMANARTSAVLAGVHEVYDEEITVLENTRYDCDELRASGVLR